MPYKDENVKKEFHKQRSREHYLKNQSEIKARTAERKKKFKEEWAAYKSTLSCSKCNFAHPAALDFHHVNPEEKEGNIHRFLSNGQHAKLKEELKKCIVLCANCHRIHHYDEKNPTEVGSDIT